MKAAPAVLLTVACAFESVAAQEPPKPEKQNWFDDPFFQVASGMRNCPVPEGPLLTAEERRAQRHSRLERGTSCWLAGRCADSNAYLPDVEVVLPELMIGTRGHPPYAVATP